MPNIYRQVIKPFIAKINKPISDYILQYNKSRNIDDVEARLKEQAYLSPQDVPFKCGTCDHFNKIDTYCKALKCYVEYNGCCNIWQHNGIHG